MYTGSGKSLSSVDIIPRYNDQLTQDCDTWKLYGTQEEDVIENINHANAEWEYDLREICEGKNFNLHPDVANSLPRAFVDLKNLMSVKIQSSTSSIKINDFSHIVTHIKDDEDSLSIVNLESVVNNGVHDITPGNAYVIAPLGEWSDIQIDSNKIKGTFCGDGIITNNEECDDGNQFYYDGCNADCTVQVRYLCSEQTYLAGTDWPKTNAEVGSCLLQDSSCGDGLIDNSAAFHTQQQYRRIPHTEMTVYRYFSSTNQFGSTSMTNQPNLIDVVDPAECAAAFPIEQYTNVGTSSYPTWNYECGLLGPGTGSHKNRFYISWPQQQNKIVSKIIIHGHHHYYANEYQYKPEIRVYSSGATSDGHCSGDDYFHLDVDDVAAGLRTSESDFKGGAYGGDYYIEEWSHTPRSGTALRNEIDTVLTFEPHEVNCISIRFGSAHMRLLAVKVYEAVGHAEECDGESYCDTQTCQLLPTAYCKPRPAPVPTMIFSAKRSLFEYNAMYSGLMTSVAGQFNHYPRLMADDTYAGVITPINIGNKIAIFGHDVHFAGGDVLLGEQVSFTAFVMLSSNSTDIVTFKTTDGNFIKVAYASNNLELSNPTRNRVSSTSFALDPLKETYIAVVFHNFEVMMYAANEGATSLTPFGPLVYTGIEIELVEIHIATFEFLTVASVHIDKALTSSEVLQQFNFQDVYGAGALFCAVSLPFL